MGSLLDLVAGAAYMLDARGCILAANAAADALLTEHDTPLIRIGPDGRLVSSGASADRSFDRVIQSSMAGTAGSNVACLTRDDGRPLGVICTALHPADWHGLSEARLLVSFADPHGRPRDARHVLRGCFRLTLAEAEVAALIGSGMGGPEIAEHLGNSRETIKRHLAQIFEKTGARTQVNLARLISTMLHR